MSEQIVEDDWPQGWIASSSAQADFGQGSQGLLRMDNLTLDEKGSLRLANRPTNQGNIGQSVHSIFGAYMNALKYRYTYDASGNLLRNYGASNSLTVFDKVLATGGATKKAGFLTALGHTLCLAGSIQIKDRGDINWPITIPQPAAPVLTNQAASTVDLSNLDGSSNYTNWTNIGCTSFNNTGNPLTATVTGNGAFRTVFSGYIDTTNFGVTGEDTPNDLFTFNFQIDDFTQLNLISVEFLLQDPTAGAVTDEYYCTLGIQYTTLNSNGIGTATLPTIPNGVTVGVTMPRSMFLRNGTNSSLNWSTVKAVWITINTFAAAAIQFGPLIVGSGAVTGAQSYVCVEFNDTGQFVEYSIASTQVDVTASVNFIKVDRSGTPCNSQCNGIITFRNNTSLGQFVAVNIQTGAYGFTPAYFIDKLSDTDALTQAATDPTRVLQFYRTQLPTDIIGAIYFGSRVIYLTTSSFIPSYQLDLGSYDSRFTYELNSTNSETCLFIAALSVGTFIVATTVDFYQVSGTFNPLSITNPDGTVTTTLDVTVAKLGISDPAVSSSFREVEGNILYISASGLRSMSNGISTLLNTSLDLLFRNENRYGFSPVALVGNDQDLTGLTSSGGRIYLALSLSNGTNAILVSTYNPPTPSELRGANYWRPLTTAAQCVAREQDGTVIYGDNIGNIGSLETAFTGNYDIVFLTQYNFGQHPASTRSMGGMLVYIDTGGTDLSLTVNGLQEDGSILSLTKTLNANGAKILAVDISALTGSVAFQLQITGNTSVFELNYLILLSVEEYPPKTFYAILPPSNFGKDTLKKLSKWGFVLDSLGSAVTVKCTADNTVVSSEASSSNGISTEFWFNTEDLKAVDWKLEVIAPSGMHFFKFMPPDILQVYPPGRKLDQVGPMDLNLQGIVYGMRIRVETTTASLNYVVLDNDVEVYSNTITTTPGTDSTYIEKFPKGVNTSVCRILISADSEFYRFSLEVEVRTTGGDVEPGSRWIQINAK